MRAQKQKAMVDRLAEKILTFEAPDEALERAASAEQNAFTLLHYCRSL